MRFRMLLCFFVLALHSPMQAQDSDYPTLQALANLRVPAFDYADMVSRFSWQNPRHTPPENPREYEIGDRENFNLSFDEDWDTKATQMELRGLSRRVLIWVQTSVNYPIWRANNLARRLETKVLDPLYELFKASEPPGVDGDPRLHVAMIDSPEAERWGYFDETNARPRSVDPRSDQIEMVVVNLSDDVEFDFYDDILLGTIAHEYTHALQFYADPGEEWWIDEGMATYAEFYTTDALFLRSSWHFDAEDFLEAPNIGLTEFYSVEETSPKYGAGYLFLLYLSERFDKDILARVLAEEANGWRGVQNVLRDYTDTSAEEIFADWVLANYFLDSRRGYGYRALEGELEESPESIAALNSFPAAYKGALPQYSTDYIAIDVRGADKLYLRLWQAAEAKLIDAPLNEGEIVAYAVTSEESNSRLTRAFKLDTHRQTWLEFRLWYDLDEELEYAYVTISDDDGETWRTLRGNHMQWSEVYDDFYRYGYTGSVRFWRKERIDLSDYAPGEVLISFEVMSDFSSKYGGMAIDDLRIPSIDYLEGFESPDESWIADGWIFTDNRLPNSTWLQVVQETRDGLHVSRILATGNGELTVDLLPGVSQALVAISPVVPVTNQPTEYELEAHLMDAAGEIMVITRECTVTTTHALNFRARPNGNKIGLIPEGTAVDALDREGDWFKVDYNGAVGWVHADYVREAGNCP
ncbi:MAG: immune inhibitor A [Chloroflexi bacterium]|nr:immune inhibitor A [Chloroflexota bacterium]